MKTLFFITAFAITIFLIVHKPELIDGYTVDQWCDAIHHEEGPDYGGIDRETCFKTVEHKYENYKALQDDTFIYYLSEKYCPLNSKSWAHNVKYWLEKSCSK